MDLTNALAYSGGSLAFGVVSGLIPVLNTEAYLVAVAAFAPGEAVGPVIVLGGRTKVPSTRSWTCWRRRRRRSSSSVPTSPTPFSQELERAARRGVRVTVVTSERHNFPLVRQALAHVAARSPLELRLYPDRMTHMRALLIDGRALVMGSANFDFWSYRCQQEYVAVVTEPGTVAAFRQRVAEPDLACSKPSPRPDDGRGSRGVEARLAGLALIASLCARARD